MDGGQFWQSWVISQAQGGGGPPGFVILFYLVPILLLFYFMLIRPERQKQARHQYMLASLKKNDRVVTIGGIKGIVSNVQKGSDEVIINIDESTGTKIRVTLASIARVVETDKAKSSAKKS